MAWADIIIILVASLLAMEMKRLEKQTTYNCPPYCAVDHSHFCDTVLVLDLDWQSRHDHNCMER